MRAWYIALCAAALASAPEAGASPRERGMLEGVVTSAPIGLAVPNASVTLRSTTTGWFDVRTTDNDGTFRFEDLPAGLYSLEARAEIGTAHARGLQQAFVSPVIVIPGLPVTENLVLLEGARRSPLVPDLAGSLSFPPDPASYGPPRS